MNGARCLLRTGLQCFGLILLLLLIGWAPRPVAGQTLTNAFGGVPLTLMNRPVAIFRAPLGSYSPEQRAAAAAVRIESALQKPGRAPVTSLVTNGQAEIRVHGEAVFYVLPNDVSEIEGETFDSVTQRTVQRLDRAVQEMEELRDRQGLLKTVAKGLVATVLVGGFLWLLARNRRWAEGRLIRLTANHAERIRSHALRVVGMQNVVVVLRGLMTTLFWGTTALALFWWLEFMLRLFPHTRPLGEQLEGSFVAGLGRLVQGAVRSLPDLGVVVVVLALARFVSTAARRFFAAVAQGHLHSRFFDSISAPIAQRLLGILIWITAIIVAFPYIPGSQTPAFRGISVLVGLMFSLGSGNLIGQLVGGLVMVYNRTCRPGDFVRVGEYEGTVSSVGFFSSRLVTLRNEEIVLPNSQIAGGALINYSRLNDTQGVMVPATVSIGYGTPWRQVQAMLLEAARRTGGLRTSPSPWVLQVQLGDFYVVYELRVALETPAQRSAVLSILYGNIQDVFNEYGVQILSPHYRSDPPQPVVVPREKWHEAPALPPGQEPGFRPPGEPPRRQ